MIDQQNFANSVVLSFGIGNNIDFEMHMIKKGVSMIYAYDHSISQLPQTDPKLCWFQKAVHDTPNPNSVTVEQILAQHNLSSENNLIMKCDIEDSEWSMIEQTPESVWSKFSQIVIEFHFLERITDWARLQTMHRCWTKLNRTHACVHVHGNNWGPLQLVNQVCLPQCIEVTYLRRDLGQLTPSGELFPTAVDQPNCAGKEDYWLGSFRFMQ